MANSFLGSSYDKTKLTALLKEAQDAHHALQTGTKAMEVERDGRKVKFSMINIMNLRMYITELQASLSLSDGRGRSPARMNF